MILGIDEVGRGPWAGPLVVGAVVLGGVTIDGLTDSKKLSKKRREELDIVIRQQASGFGLGWVSAKEIDEIGLSAALKLATIRAVTEIKTFYDEIIIDGTVNFLSETNKGQYVTTLKKADLLIPSVSAASIIAKVARDNYMAAQDAVYLGYKFSSHVGYGTAAHSAAIEKLGVTPLHRLSFAPLAKYTMKDSGSSSVATEQRISRLAFLTRPSLSSAKLVNTQTFSTSQEVQAKKAGFDANVSLSTKLSPSNTTKRIGDAAETEVANYLVRSGHKLIERNWKTKYCEIDIITRYKGTIYFTEVKYRKKSNQGDGLVAITSKKLAQMKFAARFYNQLNKSDDDLLLAVAAVSGDPMAIETWLEIK